MVIKFENTDFIATFEADSIDVMKNIVKENIVKFGINEFEYCWTNKGESFNVWGDGELRFEAETTDTEKMVELIGERVEKFGYAIVIGHAWNDDHTEGKKYDINVWDFENEAYKRMLAEIEIQVNKDDE